MTSDFQIKTCRKENTFTDKAIDIGCSMVYHFKFILIMQPEDKYYYL